MNPNHTAIIARLQKPAGAVDVVIDTDTYNEIDDQFALAYLIRSSGWLNLKGIYAAPFLNRKVASPKEGMERSHREILSILSLMEAEAHKEMVYKGSDRFLSSETEPVISEAAGHLARLAMDYTEENPLYVIAIAAITNVTSALLINPDIKSRIVVVWLGGNAHDWHDNKEFNLHQDIAAARALFLSGVAVVQLPCAGVVSAFTTSGPELEYWLRGKNRLCDYLVDITAREAAKYNAYPCWTRKIWDVTAVAWLLPGEFMLDRLEHRPIPEYDGIYGFNKTGHMIRYVYHINRDALFADLFEKLARNE